MSDHTTRYSDPKYSTPICFNFGTFTSPAAVIQAIWRPFYKVKIQCIIAAVVVAGTGANGVNVYRNGTSAGTIVNSASAAGYKGTLTLSGTEAIFDTTDTMAIYSIGSETNLKQSVVAVYQNTY